MKPRRARSGRAVSTIVTLALCAMSRIAGADPTETEKETARNLMRQGDAAYEARDYGKALSFYQAAHAIMGVPTTGIALARTQERMGLLLEARASAREVAKSPARPNEPPAFTSARAEATTLADALEARIPALTIRIRPEPAGPGASVTIDGARREQAADGSPHRLNPGPHRLTASAPGHRDAASEVRLQESDRREVTLELLPLASDTSPRAPEPSPGVTRPLGFVALGVGFVGLGVGAVTGIMSAVQTADLKERCNGVVCPTDAGEDLDRADTLGTVANVALIAGGVAVVAGVVLLVASTRSSSRAPANAGQTALLGGHF